MAQGSGKQHLCFPTLVDMKFISIVTLLAAPFAVSATRISWDSVYDNPNQSLAVVACSNGLNGMLTKGYRVFGDLPTFPNIGGSSAVAGWNSSNCGPFRFVEFDTVTAPLADCITGTCWNVTYQGEAIAVTVIDYAGDGYNLSEEAMNTLTCVEFFSLFSCRIRSLMRTVATAKPSCWV